MYREQIDAYFDKHREEFINDIVRLVAVKSISGEGGALPGAPYGKGCREVLDLATKMAEEKGFHVRNFDNRVITADLNDKEPELGMLAHLDVVPEGEGWNSDPYKAVVKDGKIYGRGASDNKGPAVCSMHAMRAAKEINPDLSKGCRVIMGSDEELGFSDIHYYLTVEKCPPKTFVPDVAFPVMNTEKGRYYPTFEAKYTASNELPRIVSFESGHTTNIVPEGASFVVEGMSAAAVKTACDDCTERTKVAFTVTEQDGKVQVEAKGASGHAAYPKVSNSALTASLEVIANLPLAKCPSYDALCGLHELFPHGDGYGRAVGIAQKDEIAGDLTCSFTILKYTPESLWIQFDSRTPLCANKENVADVLEAKLAPYGLEVIAAKEMVPPHHVPEESDFVQTLLHIYEDYTGQPGYCNTAGGNTYGHDIEGAVVFGAEFPGDDSTAHTANEFCEIDKLILAAKMFTQAILDICK